MKRIIGAALLFFTALCASVGLAQTIGPQVIQFPLAVTLGGTGVTTSTGTGAGVHAVSPSLTTPNIGSATATIITVGNPGSVFGTCSGNKAAPTNTNMNLYLYNASGTNFQGIGCDNGTGDMFFATGTAGPANRMSISAAGLVSFPSTTTGTNSYFACLDANNGLLRQASSCTISSIRFKDMGAFVGPSEALSKVMQLQPVTFTMKEKFWSEDPNTRGLQIGLTAENVADVDTRASVWEDDGKTPKSYRPESIIALLVGAVQELRHDNDNLRREIAAMKAGR